MDNNTRKSRKRKRCFNKELSLNHPLFLQFYFLINDIKTYLEHIKTHSTLVDIGCGTKPYEIFVNRTIKYFGVDIDEANENIDLVSSAYSIDLDDNYADYVVSFQVMEHLEEPYLMLQEAYRILKKNGEIFITVPMSEHLHEEPYDFFRYTEYGLTYLLTKAGFKNIEIIRQGTTYANIGRRLAQLISGRRLLKILVPVINLVFVKLEKRTGCDVMNYAVKANK